MTPEETDVVLDAVAADVKAAQRFQLELTLAVMRACGARVSI